MVEICLFSRFIDLWNEYVFFQIGRTIDYSDLIALIVIPFTHIYQTKKQYKIIGIQRMNRKPFILFISLISIITFFATSFLNTLRYDEDPKISYKYKIACSPSNIITIIDEKFNTSTNKIDNAYSKSRIYPVTIYYDINPRNTFKAAFRIAEVNDSTIVELIRITINEPLTDEIDEKKVFRKLFEELFINELKKSIK